MKTAFTRKPLVLALLGLSAVPVSALAVPSASSPYVTDPQNSYVQDQTSEGLSNLNTVLCIMDSIKPADMVNKGSYIALVDMNKCDSGHQSSTSDSTAGSSGATSTPNYMTAVVDVTRASNSDPMIGKMWMSMTQDGQQQKVMVHLTATQSPTDAPPYGVFRVDYVGKDPSNGDATVFNGFVDANGTNISSLDVSSNGGGNSNNAFVLNAPDASSGSGTMDVTDYSGSSPAQVTFNFAYDSDETANGFPKGVFLRSDGIHAPACFNRAKSAAQKSVWRYGTYESSDGARVDQAHPGFPIQANDGTNTYWGYASYWGVNFQGLDVPDGQMTGVTITDQRPGNTTTYNMFKNSGKLTKWTQQQSSLGDMDGIPFTFWGDLGISGGQTDSSTVNSAGFGSWEMHWDKTQGKFVITGSQVCDSGPCTLNALSTPATVTGTAFDTMAIQGWSNSFGGNINIPPQGGSHANADEVDYYTQSDIIPGTAASLSLHCLSNCPTAASLTAFNGGTNLVGSVNSPFDATTATQWNSGSVSVDYTFGSSGLKESNTVLGVIVTDKSKFEGMYQNGIQSGRLFDSALPTSGCPNGGSVCEPGNPTVYYTWATGPNQWNQSIWLTKTSDSSVVSFDPPETVSYTVPDDSATYGSWANKNLQLQFNGFGDLQGIPGSCVSPQDNTATDCSTPGARYVPAFSIADGETMTLNRSSGNITLVVKALDAEMRLDKVDCSSVSAQLPASPLTLPTAADAHDPSSSSDAYYVGTEPTVTDPPKYIDGVLQE